MLLEWRSCNIGRGREGSQAVRFGGPKSFGTDPATGRFLLDRMGNDRCSLICGSGGVWARRQAELHRQGGESSVAGPKNEQEMRNEKRDGRTRTFFLAFSAGKESGTARMI